MLYQHTRLQSGSSLFRGDVSRYGAWSVSVYMQANVFVYIHDELSICLHADVSVNMPTAADLYACLFEGQFVCIVSLYVQDDVSVYVRYTVGPHYDIKPQNTRK